MFLQVGILIVKRVALLFVAHMAFEVILLEMCSELVIVEVACLAELN